MWHEQWGSLHWAGAGPELEVHGALGVPTLFLSGCGVGQQPDSGVPGATSTKAAPLYPFSTLSPCLTLDLDRAPLAKMEVWRALFWLPNSPASSRSDHLAASKPAHEHRQGTLAPGPLW